MRRTIISLMVALMLLCLTETSFAGIEPVPWQPQINKLNSIMLNLAFIQSSVGGYAVSKTMPLGSRAVTLGIRYNITDLEGQLAEVMAELPPYSELGDSQQNVFYALEGIRIVATGIEDPLDYILWRMGIEPSPWHKQLDSMTTRISGYLCLTCPPGN